MATATATTVVVRFDPTATSMQADIIGPATQFNAGVMTAEQVQELDLLVAISAGGFGPKIFTNLARPAPNDAQFAATLADGRVAVIWNSTDRQPNYSDGVNWYDAAGNLT